MWKTSTPSHSAGWWMSSPYTVGLALFPIAIYMVSCVYQPTCFFLWLAYWTLKNGWHKYWSLMDLFLVSPSGMLASIGGTDPTSNYHCMGTGWVWCTFLYGTQGSTTPKITRWNDGTYIFSIFALVCASGGRISKGLISYVFVSIWESGAVLKANVHYSVKDSLSKEV